MGYYVRAFCTSSSIPRLADVIEWTNAQGVSIKVDPESATDVTEPIGSGEDTLEILYKEGKRPFLVDVNKKDGTDTSCQEEIDEFLEMLEDVRKSKNKERVINHLQSTQYIIACQLLSDMDDDGYETVAWFLQYFTEHCGGMVQFDGEGFYDGLKLIVKLE